MELYNKENASPTIANAFEMERVQGRAEGEKKVYLHIVQNLLKKDWSIEHIADVTELSIKEILDIQDEMLQ